MVSHYLQAEGGKVLKNNFRCPSGEVDIIYRDRQDIVFVEVKTWRYHSREVLSEVINEKKRERIYQVAQHFLVQYPEYLQYACRIDVVFVEVNPIRIHHITGAIDTWEGLQKK